MGSGTIDVESKLKAVASSEVEGKVKGDLEIEDPSSEVASAALTKNRIGGNDDERTGDGDGDTDNQ